MIRADVVKMAGRTVVIAGGGFGGLAAANELRARLGEEHRVILVDRRRRFYLGFTKLWVMTGERPNVRASERSLVALRRKGIEYINEEILGIDPAKKAVRTESEEIRGDDMIVALGADLAPSGIDGFAEGAYNLYAPEGAEALQGALRRVQKGPVVVLITRTPFKCPPAPYEAAFLIDWILRERGIRERVAVKVYSPEPFAMPTAGPVVGGEIAGMLAQRGIEYSPKTPVKKVDPARQRLLFDGFETEYEVLVGIPPHIAPKVVRDAGLTDESGWVTIDRYTMRTRFDGVYAVGDSTIVPLGEGRFLPKAGVFAAAQGRVVAQNIAAEVGGRAPDARFDGKGFCWVEVGGANAALGEGDFYATPVPQVVLHVPSAEQRRAKEEYERQILNEWLG
jgi:sulfide:quinone oxidoreductase